MASLSMRQPLQTEMGRLVVCDHDRRLYRIHMCGCPRRWQPHFFFWHNQFSNEMRPELFSNEGHAAYCDISRAEEKLASEKLAGLVGE